jgi:hypothetical protein
MEPVIRSKGPVAETFHLTEQDRARFEQAHNAYAHFRSQCDLELGLPDAQSLGFTYFLGERSLTAVAVDGYDERALTLCELAFKFLEGRKTSDIVLVIERPPRLAIDGFEEAFVERIATHIGSRAGLAIVDPHSSLGSTGVIKRAIELGKLRNIPADEILGATINAVAYPATTGLARNFAKGIDTVAEILGKDALVKLYHAMSRAIPFSPLQLRELRETIDRALRSAGVVEPSGQPIAGSLYTKEGLTAILSELPGREEEVLGYAAGHAAPEIGCDDIVRSFISCYESWGGCFKADLMHRGTILIRDYVDNANQTRDHDAQLYLRGIYDSLHRARYEATERCVRDLVESGKVPKHMLYIAEKSIANVFCEVLARTLREGSSNITSL